MKPKPQNGDAKPVVDEVARVVEEGKRSKKPSPRLFRANHSQLWGIKIVKRDPDTQQVRAVVCRFCITFGRENKLNHTDVRKPVKNAKRWEGPPFRTDSFKHHMLSSHPQQFAAYRRCQNQSSFFDEGWSSAPNGMNGGVNRGMNEGMNGSAPASGSGIIDGRECKSMEYCPPEGDLPAQRQKPARHHMMNPTPGMITNPCRIVDPYQQGPVAPPQRIYQQTGSKPPAFHQTSPLDPYSTQHTPVPRNIRLPKQILANILDGLDLLKQAGYGYDLMLMHPPTEQHVEWQGYDNQNPAVSRYSSQPLPPSDEHVVQQHQPQPVMYGRPPPPPQHQYRALPAQQQPHPHQHAALHHQTVNSQMSHQTNNDPNNKTRTGQSPMLMPEMRPYRIDHSAISSSHGSAVPEPPSRISEPPH